MSPYFVTIVINVTTFCRSPDKFETTRAAVTDYIKNTCEKVNHPHAKNEVSWRKTHEKERTTIQNLQIPTNCVDEIYIANWRY